MLEWDRAKRQRTLQERGIDFADMGALWDGRPVVEAEDTRRPYPERRLVRVGRVQGRLVVVTWTPAVHEPANQVRIISAIKAVTDSPLAYHQAVAS